MNALAVAGEADGIRVNAISPVAATRTFRRAAAQQELRPEQVDPSVAFLASSQRDVSGVILQASNDHFSVSQWKRSAGIDFGEAIADQWSTITGA